MTAAAYLYLVLTKLGSDKLLQVHVRMQCMSTYPHGDHIAGNYNLQTAGRSWTPNVLYPALESG